MLLVGCGIPQEQYDAVVTDLNRAQQEVQSVEAELGTSESKVSELTSSLETTEANLETTEAELEATEAELEVTKGELAEIKAVYPPRDFSSVKELQDWLLANDVSDRPASTTAENYYSKALQIQEDALRDGYIVSVDLDAAENYGEWYISCIAVIDGDIWAWDPESDEPINFSLIAEFMKVK